MIEGAIAPVIEAATAAETVVAPVATEAGRLAAATVVEQGSVANAHNTLTSLAEEPLDFKEAMSTIDRHDGLLTEGEYTGPKRQEQNDTSNKSDSLAGNTEAPKGPSDEDMKKMAESNGLLTKDEFDKTETGEKELATKTANECLSSATDSVRADILKDMAKDGEPVKLDADGWPVDRIQKVKVLDAMEKRQGEIEDNALKATVAEGLGPIPKDPQGERKWREDYKDGVDKALDAKKKLKDSNGAKAADAAGTAGAAPATGETAPSAAASSKEAAATTPEATAEKKDSAEKQNTLGQAFKDATEYLLAPNKQKNEKPGTRSKEVIMEEVKKFDATEAGKGYLKKFIFAQISLTAILGVALEGASNLDQKAQAELQKSKQSNQAAA